MKKCKKYLSLIYKELDGIITDKQKNDLATHIKKCDKCREEYMIITQIKSELSKEDKKPLPENFRQALHTKLVEANLSGEKQKGFSWRVFGNVTATACVALAITLFAVSSFPEFEKVRDAGIPSTINEQENQTQVFDKDLPSGSQMTNDLTNATPPKIKSLAPDPETVEESIVITDDTVNNEALTKNTNLRMMPSSPSEDSSNPMVITVKQEAEILKLIPYAVKDKDETFRVPYEKIDETKEILKDFIISVENETSEEVYFIIRY